MAHIYPLGKLGCSILLVQYSVLVHSPNYNCRRRQKVNLRYIVVLV
jgi:hypothetical protein